MKFIIETDNALGSHRGDVDDGFALVSALLGDIPIEAIVSTYGNTDEESSFRNCKLLTDVLGVKKTILRGSSIPGGRPSKELVEFLRSMEGPVSWICLGPLTTLSWLIENEILGSNLTEVWMVGGNKTSMGFLPPFWPMEFNLVKDQKSTSSVFENRSIKFRIFPLDQCRRAWITPQSLQEMGDGKIASFLVKNSQRWVRRNRLLLRKGFPIWDLVAVSALFENDFSFCRHSIQFKKNGQVHFYRGDIFAEVLDDFSPDLVWQNLCQSIKLADKGL